MKKSILCISGSLRQASTNSALLGATKLLSPHTMDLNIWIGAGDLPHFNPDLESSTLPETVQHLRALAADCDGIIFACPEYARGIPGTFKNVLDWLVGSETFFGKKIALFNASPRASAAQDALRVVLTTMAAEIIEEACIAVPLISKTLTSKQIADDIAMAEKISSALRILGEKLDKASSLD